MSDFVNPNHIRKQHAYALHVLAAASYQLGLAITEIEKHNPHYAKLPTMRQIHEQIETQLLDE